MVILLGNTVLLKEWVRPLLHMYEGLPRAGEGDERKCKIMRGRNAEAV